VTTDARRHKKRRAAALAAVAFHRSTRAPEASIGAALTRWKLSGLLGLMQRPEPPAARRFRT
jgi:hypothetical protein